MINFYTTLRAICTATLVVCCLGVAHAESVLNFTPAGSAEISVTNISPYPADIRFTLYDTEGAVASGTFLNNPSYRVPPMGQLLMSATEIFRAKEALPAGWIQATSSATGLQGVEVSGDFATKLDGTEAGIARTLQVIPFVNPDPAVRSTLLLTNPGAQTASVTVSFFNESGGLVREVTLDIPARAQRVVPTSGVVARVAAAGAGVMALAVQDSARGLVLIDGQAPDAGQSPRRVIPYFRNGGGTESVLVLANPSATPALAAVSFMNPLGIRQYLVSPLQIPGNGSVILGWQAIAGLLAPSTDGWLLVESAAPLAGVALVKTAATSTAIPLQVAPSDRSVLSRTATSGEFRLVLVGAEEEAAEITLTLGRADGTTAAQRSLIVPPLAQVAGQLKDLLGVASTEGGDLTLRSSVPVYVMGLLDGPAGSTETFLPAQRLLATVVPPAVTSSGPQIRAAVDGAITRGAAVTIVTDGVGENPVLFVNGLITPIAPVLVGTTLHAELPVTLEPGLVTLMVRSSRGDSNSQVLGVFSPDGSLTRLIKGLALFQKVEVSDAGLDLSRTSAVPIRNARVEIVDRITQAVISVSQTDNSGHYVAAVPEARGITVRVVSSLRFQDLRVLNNTDANRLYSVSRDLEGPEDVDLFETTRNAGAFNILDIIQLGNSLLASADPRLIPPAINVYWSERNTNRAGKVSEGQVGTTFFNLATNSGYVLGDRNSDSDEFDDAVILHEYAHMLAARFSRDDSPGGAHLLGDVLDPRLAWSEGFANFFSSAARGSAIYRDSKGPTGALGVRYDLEENVPTGDRPGYSSEASVQGLLWDLFDGNNDDGDNMQFPFGAVWTAFTNMRNDRFVYLPYFLEHFLDSNPEFTDGLRNMVVLRSIDFQPGVRPSVTNPFPRSIASGVSEARVGEVDSVSTRRTNLAGSAHFFTFNVATTSLASLQLVIEGLGPANNPGANDLDLFLYDSNGRRVDQSDSGLNGQSERMQQFLAPGTYFVEVRSYYIRAETNSLVFNSGRYRLTLSLR